MKSKLKLHDSLKLIKNFKTTGTITPSSKKLVERLLAPIDFSETLLIAELGPGNGCITKALLERMNKKSILLCLEVNQDFASELKSINDSRLRVFNSCASSMKAVLEGMGVTEVDHIVSSLPLALIKEDLLSNILSSARSNLKDGGRFLQYQYSLANYGDMKPIFSDIKLKFTLRNMPPAFVYDCLK